MADTKNYFVVNQEPLLKYRNYTNEQLKQEFILDEHNPKQEMSGESFVFDHMQKILAKKENDKFVYYYVRSLTTDKDNCLAYAVYRLMRDNFAHCDYALNLEAITKVLEEFAKANSRNIPTRKLEDSFVDFFEPVLRRAYIYANRQQYNL